MLARFVAGNPSEKEKERIQVALLVWKPFLPAPRQRLDEKEEQPLDSAAVNIDVEPVGSNADVHTYVAIRGTRTDELRRPLAVLVDWGETLSWEPADNFENHGAVDDFQLRVCNLDQNIRIFGLEIMEPRFLFMEGVPIGEEIKHIAERLSGKFVCQHCSVGYQTSRSLRRHQKSHGRPLVGIDTTSKDVANCSALRARACVSFSLFLSRSLSLLSPPLSLSLYRSCSVPLALALSPALAPPLSLTLPLSLSLSLCVCVCVCVCVERPSLSCSLLEAKRCDVCGKTLYSSVARHKKAVHKDWVCNRFAHALRAW